MKKQNSLLGYLLLALGIYYLLQQIQLPFLSEYSSWPTLLIIIGLAFLFHSYVTKDYSFLFTGVLILELGIHFYARKQLSIWPDHWGMYLLLPGIAFLISHQKNKSGLIPGLILVGSGLFVIISPMYLPWLNGIQEVFHFLEKFWPLVLIVYGVLLIKKK
ncbi:DUF5668 domain-containing protein [Halobacillus yeomjeoni]|uniref:LiaI-LiaF-like transmembrane region domain-containing protein n=1 Tax=Halobacillus yeomjeoni TaxID=311194 RepID=A0A931HV85_9BACI|nr:DUF5668 domain-containing protein [Halobacillus yeomjeoni]MBH0230046.1 hypothetical protein [Halobacillus yeomjeoni]MCA0982577.1 DUF5668 domain-containing protein [Halobacillus yeomjeoni]